MFDLTMKNQQAYEVTKELVDHGANFSHFTELLAKREEDPIVVSESTVRNIMAEKNILSPKANRKTRK